MLKQDENEIRYCQANKNWDNFPLTQLFKQLLKNVLRNKEPDKNNIKIEKLKNYTTH